MKRLIVLMLVCLLILPTSYFSTRAETSKLSYEVSLVQKEGVENNLYWTAVPTYSNENLNDDDPNTINQAEYHNPMGEELYENNLLKDSFYIILDLTKVYDLESIEINWYPKGGRCYKYIIAGSVDDSTYKEITNHADNVTEPNAIEVALRKLLETVIL